MEGRADLLFSRCSHYCGGSNYTLTPPSPPPPFNHAREENFLEFGTEAGASGDHDGEENITENGSLVSWISTTSPR